VGGQNAGRSPNKAAQGIKSGVRHAESSQESPHLVQETKNEIIFVKQRIGHKPIIWGGGSDNILKKEKLFERKGGLAWSSQRRIFKVVERQPCVEGRPL